MNTVIQIAATISVIFTVLSAVLVVVIVGVHYFATRNVRRVEAFVAATEPAVTDYLSGERTLESTVAVLNREPDHALELLVRISENATEAEASLLGPLIAAFPFTQQAMAALTSKRVPTRLKNAQILGYLRDQSAIPALMKALHDEVYSVRMAAAQSLARLTDPSAVEPVLVALSAPGEAPERRVAEVIASFGLAAAPALVNVLTNEHSYSYYQLGVAIRVCGLLRLEEASPHLRGFLEHEIMSIRLNSVRSLAAIGDTLALARIAELADDPSWEVRNVVMQAVGSLQGIGYLSVLRGGLSDPKWWVRHSAAQALVQLGADGIEVLQQARNHHPDRYARDMSAQILQEHTLHEAALQPSQS